MSEHFPYGKVQTNDTIVRLAEGTEAGIARAEFQQMLFCTGEAVTEQPILFGRAFEAPPYFTYSSIAKNNEPVITPTDCDDPDLADSLTRRVTGATIGVSDWIRDEQGMYVGANMWYRVDAVDLVRGDGVGWVNHTYRENTTQGEYPPCGQPGDTLFLIATYEGNNFLLLTTPGWDLQFGSLGGSPAHQMTIWTKPWEDGDSGLFPVHIESESGVPVHYVAVGLIRGMAGEYVDVSTGITHGAGSHVNDPATITLEFDFGPSGSDPRDQAAMVAIFYGSPTFATPAENVEMQNAGSAGLTKLSPGPDNTGFGLGHIYTGLALSTVPAQAVWTLPVAQYTTSGSGGSSGVRAYLG